MSLKTFTENLEKIFPSEPETTHIVNPGENDANKFKAAINARLRGLKKSVNDRNHEEVIPEQPGNALVERENPISVSTIKNQVINFGPKTLGDIVSRLSANMDIKDVNGNPTSQFNQFVESIKQDGLEIILSASSQNGGVNPNGPDKTAPKANPDEADKGNELASL